jgi:predicted amidohydrolase YtcJ
LPEGPSTTVLYGGTIRTLVSGLPVVEAVGFRGDRIAAVGSRLEVERCLTSAGRQRPRSVDLEGALVLPGLVDSHTHLGSLGSLLETVDLDGASSLEEALRRVTRQAETSSSDKWVFGGRWNKNLWGGRFPSRLDLDRAVPGRAVALHSKDGHCWWLSTEALRRAGVTAETADPPGGEIERAPDGTPTGILKESAGELVRRGMERPDPDALVSRMARAVSRLNAAGLVGVCNMEGGESLRSLQVLDRTGDLSLRVWSYLPEETLESLATTGILSGFGGPRLKIAGVKVFLDGALGSQTADMLEPYEGSSGQGIAVLDAGAFADFVGRAAAAGLAVAAHAIGDRATRKALDGFEISRATWRAAGLRQRIEHLQLLAPADVQRVGRLGLVASMQPIHAPCDRDVAEKHWGTTRSALGYAWRSVAAAGAVLAFGSDAPVETCDPLHGLFAAVTRRHPGDPSREPWFEEQALTPLEAVRAYTVGAAWSVGAERERGTIEVGKLADFTLLSRDILSSHILYSRGEHPIAEDEKVASAARDLFGTEVLKAKVQATIVGGKCVWGELS